MVRRPLAQRSSRIPWPLPALRTFRSIVPHWVLPQSAAPPHSLPNKLEFIMTTGDSPMRRLQRASRTLSRDFTRVIKDTTGAAAVEFGFMIPIFGLMIVSVTDIGFSVYRKMQVEVAAQVGAQYAMVNGFDASAISTAVTSASNATAVTATPSPTKYCGCATG